MNTKTGMCHQTVLFLENTQRDNGKILVADNDHDHLEFLSGLILQWGFEVVTACSGVEGLNGFVNSHVNFVFTDSKMILKDGFSLAFHVKAISPEMPVVLMVGRDKQDPSDNKEGCCFDDLLFKPFGFKDIQYTIQKYFGTGLNQKDVVSSENESCGVRLCG
jgi:two-component system sensor histidine kinase EvgS